MSFKRKVKREQERRKSAYTPGNLGVSQVVTEKKKNPDSKFYNGPLLKTVWVADKDQKGRLKYYPRIVKA